MAETLLSFGVEKLWDFLARESDRFKGVDEQLAELKSNLNLLRSFLKDADAKKHASALVRNCVEEIKEIVLDVEDIIETFLLQEELRKPSCIKKHMKRLSCIVVDRREVATEMEGISKRISKVIRDMQSFGVQQFIIDGGYSNPLQERQREMRHTFPSDNESNFVGLEQNVNKLVGYLVEKESIHVVSICGMGGIGKTTLARQVFNHEMVKNHFDGVVWVCVSQQFTRKYVWETILERLSSEYDEHRVSSMTEDKLQENLFKLLETSNSLIVLDDIWEAEHWDRIKPVFPPNKGWKVLLTSRNEGVALRADPKCIIFKPECLNPEESWTLFRMIAFPMKDTTDSEMEEMGKHMIKHCKGLPLALKVLGGLLAAQYTLHEWERINENIKSYIVGGTSFNDRNISSVYHILSLSYEVLPVYLKHCFLYLAHFPEDYEMSVGDLSYYWAAEGISWPSYYNGEHTRNIADGIIEELVKRSMVISIRDVSTSRFKTCQLHDMMREVCLLKAEEENFLQIVHSTSTAKSKAPCKSRRLIVHQWDGRFIFEREMNNPKLRSLLFINEKWREVRISSGLVFDRLQLMRVLDLSYAKFEGGKNLRVLIYLNLHVSATFRLYMPDFLKEMREMRYLFLTMHLHNKVNLELSNLINLEILEDFSTEHGTVRDLQGMTRLKALSISFNGKGYTMETLSLSLCGLRNLETLVIYDDFKLYTPTSDEGYFLDCMNLKQLQLSIYIPRLHDVQHSPSHLTSITLSGCCLEEDPMQILQKLLHLYEVSLLKKSFCGKRMVCSGGGFPQLNKLELSGLPELEEWIVEEGSMPLLHTLTIRNCRKLKELPDGLRFITSLEELDMNTHTLEFWKKLSRGGEEYYKVQHIPLLNII